jgi:hypothetical protein
MIRTILSLSILASFTATAVLQADPPLSKKLSSRRMRSTSKSTSKIEAATPLASGWSYANGIWTHVDGYKFVRGEVVRVGIQTHKKTPKPPTKAEMDAALRKNAAPKTSTETAAEKSAQRERNLAPRPAPQTGSHL